MKQKPVIIYIITKLELGGAQKVCLSLFNGLKQEGIKTILISGSDGYLVNKVKNVEDVILLSSFKREVSGLTFFKELKTFLQLIKILRTLKKKYSHVLVHTHSTKAGLFGRWAAFFAGIKNRFHTIHGYAFHDHQPWLIWWPIYLLELVTSLITTHFICVSSTDAKNGINLFPQFSKKHSIIRAAVDTTQFIPAKKALNISPEYFTFGTIACFKPQKNLFDLLNAFEQVYKMYPKARLEIIGDGDQRNEITHWIQKNDLEKAITLHGWQSQVAPIMINWNAFVLSSLWEGLPCAVVEARLLKIPVISYDTGGIHDIVVNNENGFLIQQKQWHELAQKMKILLEDKILQKKLINYPDNLEDFNLDLMVQAHKSMYFPSKTSF